MLLVHGYAEHSGRYEELGAWLAGRGCSVFAYDHRGHGRSEGVRCHVTHWGEYVDDLDQVRAAAREEQPDGPFSIVAHSMGALVTLNYLVERQPVLSSVVTSGAALSVGSGVSRFRVALGKALARVAPKMQLGPGLDPEGLSRRPEVVRAYLEDPFVYRSMTASLGAAFLDAIERTRAGADRVETPLLMLHGEDDPLCPVEGTRAFHAGVRSEGSALRTYPGLRHEIFNEPERETVYADLWRWLEETSG